MSLKRVLTKRVIDALAPAARDYFVWDQSQPGFALRVLATGKKTYCVQYKTRDALRTRRMVLGDARVLTVEQARAQARAVLVAVQQGADPSTDRKRRRREATYSTVADLATRYLEWAKRHHKPQTIAAERSWVERFILPAFGRMNANDVTRADVQRLHARMADGPYQANRTAALLSAMYRWDDRPNPCRGVERYKESKRERFLTTDELGRLGATLRAVDTEGEAFRRSGSLPPDGHQVEHPSVVPALRLLLLTGARRGEILTLKWQYVDFERRCLYLPDSKTGAKVIHLNPAALQILDALPRQGPYVLPGRTTETPLVGLTYPWLRIRARAGLPGVRIHDLRHSFASVGAAAGASLRILGEALGHTLPSTTQRYAHLAADPVKDAVDLIGQRLSAALADKVPSPPVVPLAGRRPRRRA